MQNKLVYIVTEMHIKGYNSDQLGDIMLTMNALSKQFQHWWSLQASTCDEALDLKCWIQVHELSVRWCRRQVDRVSLVGCSLFK